MLAALRLLASIEHSFNEIWGVRRARRWIRKLSDYLTILIATPIFLVVGIGLTTGAQNAGVARFLDEELALGFLLSWAIGLLPVLVGWVAFTLVYLVMPNRRARFRSAALGGLVAAILWQLALLLHIRFQVGIAKYNALYASFAALPIFLVWIQTSWLIVLFGAELAFAHESEQEYRGFAGYQEHHHAFSEQIALRAMARICDDFLAGRPPRSLAAHAAGLGVSPRELDEVLQDLLAGGLVAAVETVERIDGPAYVPARDPGRITVVEVFDVLRGEGLDEPVAAAIELDRQVDRTMARLDEEARSSAHNRTLRELVEAARRHEVLEAGSAVVEPRVQPS
jgi:membrane protein